jgi:drug/metabolite transporter (DMT)-like permease
MYRGIIFLLLAELCFTASTIFSKLLTNSSGISAIEVTFARFFLGLIVVAAIIYISDMSLIPNKLSLLIWRGVLNTIAVILFFLASQYTSITNTHMLNMTYPFFIFLFAPLFFRQERIAVVLYLFLVTGMMGIWLVINPNFREINRGDIFGLLSAVVAAFSVITLTMARKNDSTLIILLYLMSIGTVLNGLVMIPVFILPEGRQWLLIIASGLIGVLGQIFITYGYKYISARDGSLISTSRILYAVILGTLVFSEEITLRIAAGGLLIMLSIIAVSFFNKQKTEL